MRRFCEIIGLGVLAALLPGFAVAEGGAITLEAADRAVPITVAAQPIETALNEFARQSGIHVVIDSRIAGGIVSAAVQGRVGAEEGLALLLKGTGLTYRVLDGETVAVEREISKGAARADVADSLRSAQVEPSSPSSEMASAGAGSSETPDSSKELLEEVVVTGTHIRGYEVSASIITLSRADIEQSGFTSTAQLINSLPQNFSGGSSQVVATQGSATSEFSLLLGTNTPSLRGLGDATLTLLDGHRISRTAGTNGSDLAAIPIDAIERVEILADGASAIYGSDAVAGVINIILRKNYDGVQTAFTLSEPTRRGGGGQETYSLTAGTHWTGGNILFSYNGQNQDSLATRDRPFSSLAADPTSLIPDTDSDSGTLYLNQDISDRASIYASALYNRRTASRSLAFASPGFSFGSSMAGEARQYTVNTGVILRSGGGWVSGFDANTSQDKEDQDLVYSFPDTPSFTASTTQPDDREYSFEAHTSGTLAMLPGGNLRGAFGAGFRREDFSIAFPIFPEGNVSGHRRDVYAYAEFELPLIRPDASRRGMESLQLNLSGRMDHYSDFGTSTNPKFGFVYGLTPTLRVLGSYGKSFRAPLISAISTPAGGDLFFANDPRFPGGTGVALYQSGGNEDLRPEKSKSWTATINYAPENVRGLSLSGTYFSYDFRDKILAPVPDRSFPLDEPSIAPFAVIFPTMEQVQAVANSLLPPILNNADPDSTLDDVLAILDNRFVNVSTWTAHGVDLLGDYRIEVPNGMLNVSFNASKLFVKARPAPTAALTTLSGVVFGPPELKIRTGLGWSAGSLNAAGFVNYLDGATDIYSVPSRKLSSFITVDLNIGYAFPQSPGVLSGLRVDLAALNALDRSPPELSPASTTYPGIGYDSTNMSPLGRVLTLRLSKDWLQR